MTPASYEWRWRKRGPKKAGHLFDGDHIRPNSLCGQIWSNSFEDTDEDWHTPLLPGVGSKVCSKCEKQYQKLLFGGRKTSSRDLKLVGAPTPASDGKTTQEPPFELNDYQRTICLVEYESMLVLQKAKHGEPTKANARSCLMAAARMAVRTKVGLADFVEAAKVEWQKNQPASPVVEKENR